MKKTIFVCAACISIVVVYAQDNRSSIAAPPPPPQPPMAMIAPPPPPPPSPPAMEEAELAAPPAPPVTPTPPIPPSKSKFSTSVIINDHGNEISVRKIKGVKMVFIKKDGKTQKIKLATWNANRKYYEKKYGQLPPPPPAFTPKLLHLNAYFPGREPVSIDPATVRLRQDDVDVAALRVDIKDVPIVPISSEDPKQLRGQRVLVLGYPTGVSALLAKTDASLALQITSSAHGLGDVLKELVKNHAITPLATQGSLNDVLDKQLVYDANTTHGGSGGPVFGPDGKVIGVNFAILEGFSGSNFGVPIRFAEELLPK